ncbi:cyclopropane-fatty-acyl-phospholipid synthase [Actibacterium mucosum KCTC 23349]|uniref:Cyclopropane-fatty-acyl-phospholipid synthase n=1 Tax=Actibacterium mucosum KCTC 23349 TaxID=1454373 RepID=A0A037ZMX2_9RHOB|nr:cyclopropane-fatty-acyl-phospholipid synthase family protein [Actibacterium mucosum]KAJ56196.1 cyclopropane-fatty-acyl-phospholipid synthase [Actibacterium mucosum KCTC 23349]
MWDRLLDQMLTHLIRRGALEITLPDQPTRRYGDAGADAIRLFVEDPDFARKAVLNPDLTVGEAYMDGRLTIGDDDLHGFLGLVLDNRGHGASHWSLNANLLLRRLIRRVQQNNPIGTAQSNVAHHYDLSAALYDLFLDADKQYSCAYFKTPDDSLEQAQAQKKAHIAAKLNLSPGMRVLDIGCGWGGMGLTLAKDYGVRVVGVTLSEEQHKIAVARAAEAGLSERVDFRLVDYREVNETFDRIVSVGMFEHVGVPHYREYFRHVHDKLNKSGVALIHTIGRAEPPGTTSPWVLKYIFPGGYVPAMSEAMKAIEKERLYTTDVEIWRLHYADTLRHWYDRFVARQDDARELYDDRFCRMWRYYLAASEMTFRKHRQVVFQFQLTKQQDAVPLTRDYIYLQRP